jgi:hypothetical protein
VVRAPDAALARMCNDAYRMRACSTCGREVNTSTLFCPECGAKVPSDLAASPHASVRMDPNVDPLASTAPASISPARGHQPSESPPNSPLSPSAGAAAQASPAKPEEALPSAFPPGPRGPSGSTRGRTAPISAIPNPPRMNFPPQAAAPPAFASTSRSAPVRGSPVPPPHSSPQVSGDAVWQPSVVPGKRVLVQWANGQRYPGVVEQVNGPQSLVRFDAGEQRWVETRYVLPMV